MQLSPSLRRSLAALGLSLASVGASAAPAPYQASAGFRDFRLGVVDLTPNDGRSAGFTFTAGGAELLVNLQPAYPEPQTVQLASGEAGQLTLGSAPNFARIATSGAPSEARIDFSVEEIPGAYNSPVAMLRQTAAITLQPHSLLTLNGTGFYNSGPTAARYPYTYYEWEFELGAAAGNGTRVKGELSHADRSGNTSYLENIGLVYANTSDKAILLKLDLTGRFGIGYFDAGLAQPVPEPSSYAMLDLGLGLLGCLARRRGKRPA